MKKNNKKFLYESIMASVAKEVKKALNENSSANNKFVVHKCSWKYCKQAKIDDMLSREYSILAYVYDANENFLPDFTPEWLYKIMDNIQQQSNGGYIEHMESIFGMNKKFYEALIQHPDCINHDDIDTKNDEDYIDDWKNDQDNEDQDDEDYINNQKDNVFNKNFNSSIIKNIIKNIKNEKYDIISIHIFNNEENTGNTYIDNSSFNKDNNILSIITDNYFISNSLTTFGGLDNWQKITKKIIKKSKNNKYSGYLELYQYGIDNLYIELTEDGAKQIMEIINKRQIRKQNKYEYSEDTYKQDTERKLIALKSKNAYEKRNQERNAEIEKYKDLLNQLDINENNIGESMMVIRRFQSIVNELMFISPKLKIILRNKNLNIYQKLENKLKEDLIEILNEE